MDDIVAECASAHAGRLHAESVPTSDLHLRLLATRCQITELQAPSERGQTDLRIVGEWTRMCRAETSVKRDLVLVHGCELPGQTRAEVNPCRT